MMRRTIFPQTIVPAVASRLLTTMPIPSSLLHAQHQQSSSSIAKPGASFNDSHQQPAEPPAVLRKFDHAMRSNPQFRALYPQLLSAIVDAKREEVIVAANKMIDAISNSNNNSGEMKSKTDEKQQAVATPNEKSTTMRKKMSIVVVDVAFADMFYADHDEQKHGTSFPSAGDEGENGQKKNIADALQQEAADEEILDLFMKHLGAEFKQQKARIAQFILHAVNVERYAFIRENKLRLLPSKKEEDGGGDDANNQSTATDEGSSVNKKKKKKKEMMMMPNIAVTVTPPMDSENSITAKELLERIREELSEQQLFGGPAAVLHSICRRLVFSGCVLKRDEEEVAALTSDLLSEHVEREQKKGEQLDHSSNNITESSINKNNNKRRLVACRCTVETDIANRRRGDPATAKYLRFDVGVEEENLVAALGLDAFEFESQDQRLAAASEIGRRLCDHLNAAFRNLPPAKKEEGDADDANSRKERNDDDGDAMLLGEYPVLPFSFTMRCRLI